MNASGREHRRTDANERARTQTDAWTQTDAPGRRLGAHNGEGASLLRGRDTIPFLPSELSEFKKMVFLLRLDAKADARTRR